MRCPTEIELERYLAGSSAGADARRLTRHVETCDACRGFCDEARGDEALLPHLRRALDEPLPEEEAGAERVPPQYRVLRRIGAGSAGVVFEAEQRQPRRRVALKVLSGHPSARAVRRFETEAEALARLDHQGIARVFEAGTFDTPAGPHPFFALELVDGRRLDEWVRAERPSLRARLELFTRIGAAVAHAHTKGVVHRDLKAANVLVTADGRPKVVDFGVARVGGEEPAETLLRTQMGQVVGTIATMSPEQAAGDPAAVDTRTDVYGLGALLYQMLSGTLPHDLGGRSTAEALRVVEETDPVPLCARDAALPRDLETIVHKALEKRAANRYGSVDELVADVRRFLHGEPIAARPAGALERTLKFALRRRGLVAGVAAVFLALIGGLVTTSVQAHRARLAEADALRQIESTREVVEFFQRLLGGADRRGERPSDYTLREALDEAAALLGEAFAEEPAVEADLRVTLGTAYENLARWDEAEDHLSRALELRRSALGEHHVKTAEARNVLGAHRAERGDLAGARALLEAALDSYLELLPEQHSSVATARLNLAAVLVQEGELDRADELLGAALAAFEGGPWRDSANHADVYLHRAQVHYHRGDTDAALADQERALAMLRAALGDGVPRTELARLNLGALLAHHGLNEEGLSLAEEAERALRDFHGSDEHPNVRQAAGVRGWLERGSEER